MKKSERDRIRKHAELGELGMSSFTFCELLDSHDRLVEVLKFYANMDNQVPNTTIYGNGELIAYDKPSNYQKDMGQRARQVLAEVEE